MLTVSKGPSSNAFGLLLEDPVFVRHNNRLILLARETGVDCNSLYFNVFDTKEAIDAADALAWNGWYRFDFNLGVTTGVEGNVNFAEQQPDPELRLGGMDLITVSLTGAPLEAGDFAFRAYSDGNSISVFRVSQRQSLFLNRLMLQENKEDVDGETVTRFALEYAWETRFKYSGKKDVPETDLDTLGYQGPTGQPFLEPTLELPAIGLGTAGLFDVVEVPTGNADLRVIYIAVNIGTGFQLHQIARHSDGFLDFSADNASIGPLIPLMTPGSAAMTPIASLAPALSYYGEQDPARNADGELTELQRVGRLVLAMPVTGGSLASAMAVFDYALDANGGIIDLAPADQTAPLVDGTVTGGVFAPDTSAPVFPTPANIAEATGARVTKMVLGQVIPHPFAAPKPQVSPNLYMGDDGLMHLYYGGPPPDMITGVWDSLDPNLPQSMVAQYDTRVTRLVLSTPWALAHPSEEPNGHFYFNALISGAAMQGSTVTINQTSFPGQPNDLCDIVIQYPSALGLVDETWTGLPKNITQLAAVLNGDATDDAADPAAKIGQRPYFGYSGAQSVARVPTAAPSGEVGCLQFVQALPDVTLKSVIVATSAAALSYQFALETAGHTPISVTWDAVPKTLSVYGDLFEGIAGPTAYTYPSDPTATAMWALGTDGLQNAVPVLFVAKSSTVSRAICLAITAGTAAGTVSLSVPGAPGGTVNVPNIAADVAGFKAALDANASFTALQIEVLVQGASGAVLPTLHPQPLLSLAQTAVLFEALLPGENLALMSATTGTYTAGAQSHVYVSQSPKMPVASMAGLVASFDAPTAGIAALLSQVGPATPTVNRTLHAVANAPDLHGAVWVRQTPPMKCSFTGSNDVTIPVTSGGTTMPKSVNLQPQPRWTLEAWVKPVGSQQQQIVSYKDATQTQPPGAPQLEYALGVKGQQVVTVASYTPTGTDSSYFTSQVSPTASFSPEREFTWECWIQPTATPAASGSNPTPLGVIFQYGPTPATTQFAVGLAADRMLHIQTLDTMNQLVDNATTIAIPAVDSSNNPIWSHIAIIGRDKGAAGWDIEVVLNGQILNTFSGVPINSVTPPMLQIGGFSLNNATMFGQITQLRLWSFARSLPELRRTMLITLTGREFGLLGSWPMGALVNNGSGSMMVHNNAVASGHYWDAVLIASSQQPVTMTDDSFFLSVLATVGGAPAIEAPALLRNGAWNHVAITYEAGGALTMNPADRVAANQFDWMEIENSETLDQGQNFAVDAWVIVAADVNLPGALISRWSNSTEIDEKGLHLIVNRDGTLTFEVTYIADRLGTLETATFSTKGLTVADGLPHHIAAVFSSTSQVPQQSGNPTDATLQLTIWVDGQQEDSGVTSVSDVASIQVNNPDSPIYVGRDIQIAPGSSPVAGESILYFQGALGKLRFWNTSPSEQALFPEKYPRIPQFGIPKGLVSEWRFTEQSGRFAMDSVGDANGKLSTTAMWRLLEETARMGVFANGAFIGAAQTFSGTFSAGTANQFAMGSLGGTTVPGITGDIAQVALYDSLRDPDTIDAQKNVSCYGEERGLIACWNFSEGGQDITGGQNNPTPAIAGTRLTASDAPISNEGASVCNTYGGAPTNASMSAPGRIAAGNYVDVTGLGTNDQLAVLKRQFVMEPGQTYVSPVQIGELDLIYVGQVQTDPTLIGYIEGAPPVPSENLTRPYFEAPTGAPYMKYLDTSMVTLTQDTATEITFSSQSGSQTQIDFSGALGAVTAYRTGVSSGSGFFNFEDELFTFENKVQAQFQISHVSEERTDTGFGSNWGVSQSFNMGLSGDWEPAPYLNPTVGRRFLADNLGYAQVESLTGDLYSVVFKTSGASLGTLVLPNPDIPPDVNIILFPMKTHDNTKATTLDGKIGLMNDPSYPDADIRRGSYFRPAEAYETEKRIEFQKQRALASAASFDTISRGRAGIDDLTIPQANLAARPDHESEDDTALSVGLPALIPAQGLVNKFVWTADGGIYAEKRNYGARASKAFTGFDQFGGGGGITAGGAFLLKIGVAWNIDFLATHTTHIEVSKNLESTLGLSLDLAVDGEAYLKAWDEALKAYTLQAAPGKVKAYRFSTFYLPPSVKNGTDFDTIVDPTWKTLSNDPMARALRELSIVNPVWRVFHRTTYVERIPPIAASGPNVAPRTTVDPPVNVTGNLALCRLINATLTASPSGYDKLTIANAVATVINPAPTSPGTYPASVLEGEVSWWLTFLSSARPNAQGIVADPANAAKLAAIQSAISNYMYAGYATDVIPKALGT